MQQPTGSPQNGWSARVAMVDQVRTAYVAARAAADAEVPDEVSSAVLHSFDSRQHVGTRHHVVPRFLLERWADRQGRVQAYSRVEERHATRNINDLAIRDFYTFIDLGGERNSLLESLLGQLEGDTATIVRRMLSGFTGPGSITTEDIATIAYFAAFQVVRTPRHRRQNQIQADWYYKTMAQGRVPAGDLEDLTVVPHQNEFIALMAQTAEGLVPMFHTRPLTLVTLERPLLLIGDDPVVINPGRDEVMHHPDCFLTDAQIDERNRRNRRRHRRRPMKQGRILHFSSTVPSGLGTAVELILPISPRSALVWGDYEEGRPATFIEHDTLGPSASERFAGLVNDATCARALDWIVARPDDAAFTKREFTAHGPLMRVCDGTNVASAAVNATPTPIRPFRLARDV